MRGRGLAPAAPSRPTAGNGHGTPELFDAKEVSTRRSFSKPTVAQVAAYMAILSLPRSEADKFCDHYESNGWKVGKAAMRSWEAAARNWQRGYQEKNPAADGRATLTHSRDLRRIGV
jgi:hypothetical protein